MRAIPLSAALAVAAAFTMPLRAQEHAASPARAADSMVFVMGTGLYTPPDIPLPDKNARFTDPNFHTTLYRMTDRLSDGYSGPGIQNEYAKADPENADGSLVILRGNDGEWYLFDRASSALVTWLTLFHEGNQEPEPRWDPQDPNRFYFLRNLSLCAYDIARDSVRVVHDFAVEFPGAFLITTGTEGDASLDRRRWAFMVVDSSFQPMSIVVYDLPSDALVGRKDGGFRDDINWVGMSMSGEYCVVGYDNLLSPEVFTVDLGRSWLLAEGSNGHGDLALDASGRDVLVYQNVRTDFIAMSDLETGAETPLVEIPFPVNPDIGLHVSGNCAATPGWALVSTYGSKNPPEGRPHSWMDTQLFLVELREQPRVWRLAHTHAYTSLEFDGEKNYFAEAFAAINTAATRVYFGSNWGDFTPDYSETYVVELPERWSERLPGGTVSLRAPDRPPAGAAVYPNPCRGAATLFIPRGERARTGGPPDWTVFDVLGRAVLRGSCTEGPAGASAHIDLGNLPDGVYTVVALGGEQPMRVSFSVNR